MSLPLEDVLAAQEDCVDSVVIELSTTVTIDHFRKFYDGPIDSFTPSFVALADGSLVNPPLLDDMKASALKLAVTSSLFIFFLNNTLTATFYLYRGSVKNKTLFYLLLSSQVLGLVGVNFLLVPFFYALADCTLYVILTRYG